MGGGCVHSGGMCGGRMEVAQMGVCTVCGIGWWDGGCEGCVSGHGGGGPVWRVCEDV